MLPSMSVNKELLPIKGHFFLFNAGTAPLVPYLSTYARQLGFSSATVGLIYTLLPIFGLIAKPLFGVIADKCKMQKSLFILFQVVTIISFAAIYFIPESNSGIKVELDCSGGVTMLRGCYASSDLVEKCKVSELGNDDRNALCDMKCDMSSPKMWQTVCEHWQLPKYCYSNTDNITYSTNVTKVTMTDDNCANISTSNVLLDGYSFVPHCRVGLGYVDINQPCNLTCLNPLYSSVIGEQNANMTCVNEMLNYRLCPNDSTALSALANETTTSECEAYCYLNKTEPWSIMEICDGWNADVTKTCQPRTKLNEEFPNTLSFTGTIAPMLTIIEHNCVHVPLKHIEMPDGSTHYTNCIEKSLYQTKAELFHTNCEISCNNSLINDIFQSTSDNKDTSNDLSMQFRLFFTFMIISWIGQAVVVTFADAICFNLLGTQVSQYGKQRLWGSVGWGIFSLMTGSLIDVFSDDGAKKDYTVAFVLMFVFMMGDVVVSCFIKNKPSDISLNILADVGSLLSSLETCIFILWTIGVGLSTGLLWQFLFWHLEDIAELTCDGFNYIKTLQGLVSAIQTFGGEIPFMFISGFILRKLGHINMMSLVLFAFGIRFLLYSWLTNPWWVLPIEMFQGITYGMFYPTLTSYANIVSPPGTETTIQGLVGAVFEGVGVSLGSLLGGRLYESYGGWNTFRWYGIGSLVLGGFHVVAQYVFKDRIARARTEGYRSVIRYEQPNDMVFILEDMPRESMCIGNE